MNKLIAHKIVKVEQDIDVFEILEDIASIDDDFMGYNGFETLWNVSKEKNCESNFDYVMNEISVLNDTEQKIKAFFGLWIGNDSYYGDYKIEFLYNDNGDVTAFSYVIFKR